MSTAQGNLFWRVMTYPIHIFPGGKFVKIPVAKIIEASGLPVEAAGVVREVARRTGLWEWEKAEVAIELVAHFGDGIDAGKSVEELISSFGDLKTVAKLMRRGKKRNRPFWWRMQRRALQAFWAFLLVYLLADLLLLMRRPAAAVDYVAELNQPIQASAAGDQAWPIYRQAWKNAPQWPLNTHGLFLIDENDREVRLVRPGDADWPKAAEFLKGQKGLLDSLRAGGGKAFLGYRLSCEPSAEDEAVYLHPASTPSAPAAKSSEPVEGSLRKVLLPFLEPMRESSVLLAADMQFAASEGDGQRVVSDYRAQVGIARQCREVPVLASEIVGVGMLNFADQELMDINAHSPGLLGKNRVELLHAMASVDGMFDVDLTGEHDSVLDAIQRVYSDNGHGDGSMTLDGFKAMDHMGNNFPQGSSTDVLYSLSLPAAAVFVASRRETTEEAERYFAAAREDIARPLWVKVRSAGKADSMFLNWRSSGPNMLRYGLLTLIVPSLNRVGIYFDQTRAVHEAAMVALALEVYHDKVGQYPGTLAEMVPHYLPAAPVDYSTGGLLHYKLVDGKPVLYGLGKDGVDDGGVRLDKKGYWMNVPEKGDWVLYPMPEE